MANNLKKKYLFIGDTNSINLELIFKSFKKLKNKVKYILIGNQQDVITHLNKLSYKLKINLINNPLSFENYNSNKLNLFNIENKKKKIK